MGSDGGEHGAALPSSGKPVTRIVLGVEQLRQPIPGGIGTYVRGLIQGLESRSDPALSIERFASKGPNPDPLEPGIFPLVTSALSHRLQVRAWTWGIGTLPKGAQIAHLCSLAAPLGASIPTTAMVHDVSWRKFPELTTKRGRRWHEHQLRRLLASSATLIVPSRRVGDDLVADGVSAGRITIIGEGADHLADPDRDAARILLTKYGVEGPYIVCVATLEPRKNLARLVEAHAKAKARGLDLPLVIVGPHGWGSPRVSDGAVVIEGHVSEAVLAGLYAEATLLAYVPVEEGFGLPPLEAMWQATPVLASTSTPSVEGAEGVIRVDPFDVDAIARGLGDGVDQAASLAPAAHRAAQNHTWRNVAELHVATWMSLS